MERKNPSDLVGQGLVLHPNRSVFLSSSNHKNPQDFLCKATRKLVLAVQA